MRKCLAVVFCSVITACASIGGETSGIASVSLLEVPAGVLSIEITFASSVDSTTRYLSVVPGQRTTYTVDGLPSGIVTVSASAFPVPVDELTPRTTPTWMSMAFDSVLPPGELTALGLALRPVSESDVADDFFDECGDLTVALMEECDDGNVADGDCCSAACMLETPCGNGVIDDGEHCDDGNPTPGDGCGATCQTEFCGDGIVQPALEEQCDDGPLGSARCTGSCTAFAARMPDPWEPNDTCALVASLGPLGTSGSDGRPAATSVMATLFDAGDVDFFRVDWTEDDQRCGCGALSNDEDHATAATLSVPEGAGSYRLCGWTGPVCDLWTGLSCVTVAEGTTGTVSLWSDGSCKTGDAGTSWLWVEGLGEPGYSLEPYMLEVKTVQGCLP